VTGASRRARAPLDVQADLTLTVEGQPVTVESFTDLVVVDLPSVRVAVPLARGTLRYLDDLEALLCTTGLTLEVRVAGTRVVRIGADARPRTSRLPVELDAAGMLRAAVEAPVRFFS